MVHCSDRGGDLGLLIRWIARCVIAELEPGLRDVIASELRRLDDRVEKRVERRASPAPSAFPEAGQPYLTPEDVARRYGLR